MLGSKARQRPGAGVVALVLAVAGCALSDPTAGLDADAQAMIRERQALSLGPEASLDPRVQPALEANELAGARNVATPGTRNPTADELPARSRAEADGQGEDDARIPLEVPAASAEASFDLEELLAYAIENAPEYRFAKETLFLAALDLIIERHLWGPRFFNTVSAGISGTPEDGDFDQVASIVNELGVTRRLPYGGSVSVAAVVDYVDLLRRASTTTTAGETQSASIDLGFNLPLLRGAGVAARANLIQTERDLVYAVRSFERFRREFLFDLSQTYFDLLRQQGRIENLERQLGGIEALAARFNALAEAGQEPAFEAERAEQEVLFGRSNLLNARETYVSALDALKLRIGFEVRRPLAIEPGRIAVPEPELDMAEAVATGLDYRLDLQTVRDRVNDARRGVRVARNATLPDLDLDASVRFNTDEDRDKAGVDFELEDSSYAAGLTLDLPLDRRIEKAGVRSALINLERRARAFRVERDRVALQVRDSVREIEQANFNLRLQQRNVEVAERRLIGVKLRERSLGPRDTIEAQEDLLDARNARDNALAGVQTSILQFLLDTGQLRVAPDGRWLPPARLLPPAPPPDASRDAPGNSPATPRQTDPGDPANPDPAADNAVNATPGSGVTWPRGAKRPTALRTEPSS